MYKKLSAFTLTELIIVMIISGIAVSGIFSIFYISSGLFKKTGMQKNEENEWVLLDRHLTKDMFDCDSVRLNERSVIFYADKKKNSYIFSDSSVERMSSGTIRYEVQVQDIRPAYISPSVSLISQLVLVSKLHTKEVTSIYDKVYPAAITLDYAIRNK